MFNIYVLSYFRESVVLGEYNTQTEIDCIEYEEGYRECADKPIVIPIISTVLHPEWRYPGRENDIALLKLLTPVTYTGKYKKQLTKIKITAVTVRFHKTNLFTTGGLDAQ